MPLLNYQIFKDALTDDEGVTTLYQEMWRKGIYAAILLAQMLTAFRLVEAPSCQRRRQIVEARGKIYGLFVALTREAIC